MVDLALELLEAGATPKKILSDYYPQSSERAIKASLHYAAELIKSQEFVPFFNA